MSDPAAAPVPPHASNRAEGLPPDAPPRRTPWLALLVAWALVGVPLAWGVARTVEKAAQLFR